MLIGKAKIKSSLASFLLAPLDVAIEIQKVIALQRAKLCKNKKKTLKSAYAQVAYVVVVVAERALIVFGHVGVAADVGSRTTAACRA